MTGLLIVLGLTGVGKSTAVTALTDTHTDTYTGTLTLLPNRRELTDALIIPAVQRADGLPLRPVTDRLERFALTRRYRELHPGGMVRALNEYLQRDAGEGPFVFDNLRGLEEAEAAVSAFPDARFVLLDAPPLVRLSRLLGRHDPFDEVVDRPKNTSFTEQLLAVDGLPELFDVRALTSWAAEGAPESDLLKAARIIVSESQNYDMGAAADFLRVHKDAHSFLYLDTADLSAEAVRERIRAWLG